jgi:hypothetical protein
LDADLERLAREREAADREYNEALTRLDRAIQRLPDVSFDPPPLPDERQLGPLNTLWKLDQRGSGVVGALLSIVGRLTRPFFLRQRQFNAAVVDHLNRTAAAHRESHASLLKTQQLLREQLSDLLRFQSLLIQFLQQITPYVDTRDRDVAGLLRGLSGAINAVADEVMKRSDALLARDRRRALDVADLDARIADLSARVNELARTLSQSGATRTGS